MDSTRSTTTMFPQSAIVGLVALSIVVLSLAIVGQSGILPFTLSGDGSAQVVPAVRSLSFANAEGLAMYFESERGRSTIAPSTAVGMAAYHESEWTAAFEAPSIEAGLAIYRESERTAAVDAPSFEVGLAIYRKSEWTAAVDAPAFEAGLAIYRDSERSALSNPDASSNEEGMAIYLASEHATAGSEQTRLGWDIYRSSEQGR
jgi:hypothetical protein